MQIIRVAAQINYAFLKAHVNLKLGISNPTNKYYRSFWSGRLLAGFTIRCLLTIYNEHAGNP